MTISTSANRLAPARPSSDSDAPAEEHLRRFVRLAARALRAPIAYLSLVDRDRQRIGSVVGVPESYLPLRDLPVGYFLSDRVLASDEPLAIADLREDGCAEGVAAIAEGGVALLAVALRREDGAPVGVLGVVDREARAWDEEEIGILVDLARVADAELRTRGPVEGLRRTLEESEGRFRSLIEHASDVVTIVSAGGTIGYSTPSVGRVLGYSVEELAGQNAFSLLHPSDAPWAIARFARLVRGAECGAPIDCRVRHRNGSWRTLEVRVNNLLEDPAVAGVVLNAHDITETREAQENQRRLAAFLETTPDFVATFDPRGRALSVNAAFRRVVGIDGADDLSALTIADLFPPEVTDRILHEGIPAAIRAGIWSGESVLRDGEGREIPISQVILAHHSAGGTLEFLSTLGRDITERKRAEEELRRNADLLREAERSAHVGSWEWDVAHGALTWSEELYHIYGLDPGLEPITFERYTELVHPDDRAQVSAVVEQAMRDRDSFAFDHRIVRPDGVVRYLHGRGRVVRSAEGEVVRMIGSGQDVTERVQAETALRESQEQLLQSQKMDAVGRLAGGIAHDFNNLLTAIKGFTELLLSDFDVQDPRHSFVTEIQGAANRAAALTRQLLAFSRKQVLQPRLLDLNSAVSGIETMLRRLIGEDVVLEPGLMPELGKVRADPSQVEQVLVNLVVNARDAMPTGGRVMLRTANVELGADDIPAHAGIAPGPYVMLAVADSGTGMTPEVQARIFEPFFTTKEQGKGTGLGLSTVYGIVQQSGGFVEVDSVPGEGATFRVYLPCAREEVEATPTSVAAPRPSCGAETILVVEDEAAVRVLVRRVLTRSGYRILEASSGVEALELLEQYGEPIHLLLTDVVMPGMSGRELADRLSMQYPQLRILYMSGYADETIVHHGVLNPRIALLEKPFTPDVLLWKLREVLDGPAGLAGH